MATTLKAKPIFDLVGGVDSTHPSFTSDPGTWRNSENIIFRDKNVTEKLRYALRFDLTGMANPLPTRTINNLAPCLDNQIEAYLGFTDQGDILLIDFTGNVVTIPRTLNGFRLIGTGPNPYPELSGYYTDPPAVNSRFEIKIEPTVTQWKWYNNQLAAPGVATGPFAIDLLPHLMPNGMIVRFPVKTGWVLNDIYTCLVGYGLLEGNPPTLSQFPFLSSRWDWDIHPSGIFCTCQLYSTGYIPGRNARLLQNDYFAPQTFVQTTLNSGKYIQIFYEHVILASPITYNNGPTPEFTFNPNRIMWSNVFDLANFISTTTNEADFYDLATTGASAFDIIGITGMRKLRDLCIVYVINEIWQIRYVGLPQVFQVTRVISDKGNIFPYGLAADNNKHFFWYYDNAYMYDGANQPVPIGDRVYVEFFERLSTNPNQQVKTFATIDKTQNEVTWYFCQKANISGDPDYSITYSYREGAWRWAPVPNFTAALATNDVFASRHQVYRTHIPSAPVGTPVAQTMFTLGSQDTILAPDGEQVELDTIIVDARGNTPIPVYISARQYITDAITWVYVGSVTLLEGEYKLSLPRVAGRIFRFWFGGPPTIGTISGPTAPESNVFIQSIFTGFCINYRMMGAEV